MSIGEEWMRLKRGLGVYWRNDNMVQIGVDQRVRIDVPLRGPGDLDMLLKLQNITTLPELRRILTGQGGQPQRAAILVRQLVEAGCMAPSESTGSARWDVPAEHREGMSPEAETRGLIEADGWLAPAKRVKQRVSVYGLGRTGAQLAVHLAAAGVGILQLFDSAEVSGRDLGPVYRRKDIGKPRNQVLANFITDGGFTSETRTRSRWAKPHVAVVVAYEVVSPERANFLTGHLVPHLPVVVDELSIACGPWVDPKAGPCVGCLNRWLAEKDPDWYRVATQQWTKRCVSRRGEDSTLSSMAASFGAAQVVTALAGSDPNTLGRSVRFSMPDYSQQWTDHLPHPNCKLHGVSSVSNSLATGWRPWEVPRDPMIQPAGKATANRVGTSRAIGPKARRT